MNLSAQIAEFIFFPRLCWLSTRNFWVISTFSQVSLSQNALLIPWFLWVFCWICTAKNMRPFDWAFKESMTHFLNFLKRLTFAMSTQYMSDLFRVEVEY